LPSQMPVAVVRGRGRLGVESRPLPAPGPAEVLVEVSHCGVCGTDLHMVLDGFARPGSIGGHEWSGRIASVGEATDGWTQGDRVVGSPLAACGECRFCRIGRPSLCLRRPGLGGESSFQGAFAGYVRVGAAQLYRVPESLPLRTAALAEPLAVALHALTVSGVGEGDRVLVTGAGPLGLLLVAALVARGVEEVAASEPAPLRAERARSVGAGRVHRPEELEAPKLPYQLVDEPFDVVFECSGSPRAMEQGLGVLGRAGRLVLVGTGLERPRLDHNRVLLNELVVTGAYNYDAGGLGDALALLASGRLPVDELVEPEDVPLPGLLGAIERLGRGEIARKVLVAPGMEAA
jgi:2-desacetyl-2-hydroxyethyl bacteriochlorophyllide A dehydrogenase